MRMLVVVALLALAGCTPVGGPAERTVDVRGNLTRTMAASGPGGWVLETGGGALLPVELEGNPVVGGHCVTIAVDDDFPDVTDQDEVVTALLEVVDATGQSLVVVDFC